MGKYLDENGLARVADYVNGKEKLIFKGTKAQWDALTAEEKAVYTLVGFPDVVEGGAVVVDEVTEGNLNAVTSNAVYKAINNTPQIKKIQTGIWTEPVAIESQTKKAITVTMPEAMPSTNYFVILACPDISIWGIFKRVVSTTQFDISLYNFHTATVNAQNITWRAIEIG